MTATKTKARTSKKRRQPTQERSVQTVEDVLDSVSEILRRYGVAAVTTNRIAEVAGVSIGSVYQYFPGKKAIFIALHQRHIERIDRLIQSTLIETSKATLEVTIRAIVSVMINAHLPDPALYSLMASEVPHRADGAREFAARMHGVFRLALASRSLEIRPGRDLDRMAFVAAQMVDALCHGAVLHRPADISLEEAKEEAVLALLTYLRP